MVCWAWRELARVAVGSVRAITCSLVPVGALNVCAGVAGPRYHLAPPIPTLCTVFVGLAGDERARVPVDGTGASAYAFVQ